MRNYFICFFLLILSAFGNEFCLKERIAKANPGDYIVTEANKMITLLCIRSIHAETLLLEEISAPLENLKNRPNSWAEWVKQKAPGHTSWSMIEIDLPSGQILECYSFSRSGWLHLSQKESLFATLLELPMRSVPPEKQRKIGPPPIAGEPDFRKIWTPPLTFEGKKIPHAEFDVYETTWPQDDTELSGQEVSLYFDRAKECPLPFWIQVRTSHATAALRTIDWGKNLPPIHRTIPRRTPEFVGLPLKTEHTLRLNVKSPKYYKQFELYAIDVTSKEKHILSISHNLIQGEGEWKTVEIDLEELNETLEPNHRYNWLLVPIGHGDLYTETVKPFAWN